MQVLSGYKWACSFQRKLSSLPWQQHESWTQSITSTDLRCPAPPTPPSAFYPLTSSSSGLLPLLSPSFSSTSSSILFLCFPLLYLFHSSFSSPPFLLPFLYLFYPLMMSQMLPKAPMASWVISHLPGSGSEAVNVFKSCRRVRGGLKKKSESLFFLKIVVETLSLLFYFDQFFLFYILMLLGIFYDTQTFMQEFQGCRCN